MSRGGNPGIEQFADLAGDELRLLPVQAALAVGLEFFVVARPGRVDELDGRFGQPRRGHARQIAKPMLADRVVGLQAARRRTRATRTP